MSTSHPTTIPSGRYKLGWQDYAELPADGRRHQILDGDLHMTPAPSPRHQKLSHRLEFLLTLALEQTGRGVVYDAPVDVILGEHDIVQPDILFIAAEREHIVGEHAIEGPPDLVIEILSPSTRRMDILAKSRRYAATGVAHYWIVDPDIDRLDRYVLEGDSYEQVGSESAPTVVEVAEFGGLSIDLAALFA